ncbi:MAG: hypothetical protein HPY66_0633 [Firmicutes bacterium]|nr:hypothetical protein [Bacillota bacterium]MDI6706819.1 VTT domain-containing protein [Bacillota bacterium]
MAENGYGGEGRILMISYLLHLLAGMGLSGIFFIMAMEGLSIPVPGLVVVMTYAYILNPSMVEILGIALGMSITYSISSFVPYTISSRLSLSRPKCLNKGIERVNRWFRRYGEWSIAITRPFGVGNYISYLAGMAKVKPWKYAALTFIGIYPWSVAVLLLGKICRGNIHLVKRVVQNYHEPVILASLAIATVYLGISLYSNKLNKESE